MDETALEELRKNLDGKKVAEQDVAEWVQGDGLKLEVDKYKAGAEAKYIDCS
jgi:hypothetical protein